MFIINRTSKIDKLAVYEAFESCAKNFAPIDNSMRYFLEETVIWEIIYKVEEDKK
jgi:hypothetical protein